MPPRKSNASVTSSTPAAIVLGDTSFDSNATLPAGQDGTPSEKKTATRDGLSVEDLGLPRTMVQRLAKGVLPPNTQIQKDAQLAIWKSATVFVNYLASHANDNAMRLSKKTIQPKDVLDAIHDLEFDSFLPRLESELTKYNSVQCTKRNTYRKKIRDEAREGTIPTKPSDPTDPTAASGTADSTAPSSSSHIATGTLSATLPSTADADSAMAVDAIGAARSGALGGGGEPASKKVRRNDGGAAAQGGEAGGEDEDGEDDDDDDDDDSQQTLDADDFEDELDDVDAPEGDEHDPEDQEEEEEGASDVEDQERGQELAEDALEERLPRPDEVMDEAMDDEGEESD